MAQPDILKRAVFRHSKAIVTHYSLVFRLLAAETGLRVLRNQSPAHITDMKHSLRGTAINWLTSSSVLSGPKKLIPNSIKGWVKGRVAGDGMDFFDLGNGATVEYSLKDPYWARFGDNIRRFEPEVGFVLDRFVGPDTVFVDCGANIGLWSVRAAQKIGNPDQVYAIEPGEKILPFLQRNRERNQRGFTLLPNAVWSRSGETKEFIVSTSHASSSLAAETLAEHEVLRRIPVQTVSIDSIVETAAAKAPQAKNVVVKLDVEGVEKEAIEGMTHTLANRNVLLTYEDHGKEPESKVTADLLHRGMHVYYVNPDSFVVRRIESAEELKLIKTIPTKGYNFIACPPGRGFDEQLNQLSNLHANNPEGSAEASVMKGKTPQRRWQFSLHKNPAMEQGRGQ